MDYRELVKFYQNLDRAYFIDNESKKRAYLDQPLPIGFDQTISQPSLVLEMTRQLGLDEDCKVLEIGTGSGYQTAMLAEFSEVVYTIERIPELSEKAKARLDLLGYSNIFYKIGDGSEGWVENAPYDRIIVTASAGSVPYEIVEQLKPGGRMIIPLGRQGLQELLLITREQGGEVKTISLGTVVFVELKGKYGW